MPMQRSTSSRTGVKSTSGSEKGARKTAIGRPLQGDQQGPGPCKQHYLPKHCKSKIDSLKKRYKTVKEKKNATVSVNSSWPHFARLNEILATNPKIVGIPGGFDLGADVQPKDLPQPLKEEDEGGEEEHSGHLEKEPSLEEIQVENGGTEDVAESNSDEGVQNGPGDNNAGAGKEVLTTPAKASDSQK
jgi:hypothetical protein